MQRCSSVFEHLLVGLLRRVGRCGEEMDRGIEAHAVLNGLVEGVVNILLAYLVVDAVCPVVVGHHAMQRVHIAVDIEFSPYMPHDIPLVWRGTVTRIRSGSYAYAGYALLYARAALQSARSGFVVVIDDVDVHALAAVATIAAPVVDDVVAHVHTLIFLCAGTRTEAWGT